MKKLNLFIVISIIASLFSLSCKKIKTPEAAIERENWIAGFSDSIEYYKLQSSQLQQQLDLVNEKINHLLENFEYIKNPKEVTGYYILKGWNKKIPFTTTALYARINDYEKLELIATLAGSTFNRIGVDNFYSEIVPHDQAFNYRHERFNTVYFSGGKADTIAMYISNHSSDKINLEFVEGSKNKKFLIPNDEKEMISKTWKLFELKRDAMALQKEQWICSRKIETFLRILNSENKLINQ